jgi:hypothetical protein
VKEQAGVGNVPGVDGEEAGHVGPDLQVVGAQRYVSCIPNGSTKRSMVFSPL